jgi:succinyl-CoA synthetase beta subunit
MRLLEFQAKQLFAEYGIPVPEGKLVTSPADVAAVKMPAMLKAQVAVGGRGKAGGIRAVETAEEAARGVEALLQMSIKGHPVGAVLAEEKTPFTREFYVAVLYDKKTNAPMLMASAAGGVDVEQVARENPEKIIRRTIDPAIGLQKYAIRYAAKTLGIQDVAAFTAIVERLYAILVECDATLVEINPLVETPQGLVALDAKLLLDDRSEFRHAELFAKIGQEQADLDKRSPTEAECLAKERRITYVALEGNIAMIADGAGTGMLTLDLIHDEGGRAANFCEMGGLANAKITNESIEVVLANPRAKVLLITLIGGLTRMDEIADGIAEYVGAHGKTIPMVVRMCGTQEAVGKATLREIGIEPFDDMAAAVQAAVLMAGRAQRWQS